MKTVTSKKSSRTNSPSSKASKNSKTFTLKKLTQREVEANRSSAYPYTF
jgi:hypothetical protein